MLNEGPVPPDEQEAGKNKQFSVLEVAGPFADAPSGLDLENIQDYRGRERIRSSLDHLGKPFLSPITSEREDLNEGEDQYVNTGSHDAYQPPKAKQSDTSSSENLPIRPASPVRLPSKPSIRRQSRVRVPFFDPWSALRIQDWQQGANQIDKDPALSEASFQAPRVEVNKLVAPKSRSGHLIPGQPLPASAVNAAPTRSRAPTITIQEPSDKALHSAVRSQISTRISNSTGTSAGRRSEFSLGPNADPSYAKTFAAFPPITQFSTSSTTSPSSRPPRPFQYPRETVLSTEARRENCRERSCDIHDKHSSREHVRRWCYSVKSGQWYHNLALRARCHWHSRGI